MDIFKKLLNMGTLWLLELGKLLTHARVTWLEIPSPQQLIAARLLLMRENEHSEKSPVFKAITFLALVWNYSYYFLNFAF